MPLTFPAHQAAVLPLKIWKPRWFDGVALVVGSGSPDLFNAFAAVDTFDSHHWTGVWIATAFTIVYSVVLRRYAVDGLFGSLPDLGPLRARSYRVLRHGRPRLLVTSLSAFIGVFGHVLVDSFTHAGRWGATVIGLNSVMFESPLGPVTGARLLQYLGHTVGSLIGIVLFVHVVSRRHLGEWYGSDQIHAARRAPVTPNARRRTLTLVSASQVGAIVAALAQGMNPIFHMGLGLVLALLAAGAVNQRLAPSRTTLADLRAQPAGAGR